MSNRFNLSNSIEILFYILLTFYVLNFEIQTVKYYSPNFVRPFLSGRVLPVERIIYKNKHGTKTSTFNVPNERQTVVDQLRY